MNCAEKVTFRSNGRGVLICVAILLLALFCFWGVSAMPAQWNAASENNSFSRVELAKVSTYDPDIFSKWWVPLAEKRGLWVDFGEIRDEPALEFVIGSGAWNMRFLLGNRTVAEMDFTVEEYTARDSETTLNNRALIDAPPEALGGYDGVALIQTVGREAWISYVKPLASRQSAVVYNDLPLFHADKSGNTQHELTGVVGYFVSDDGASLTLQMQSISELDILLLGAADDKGRVIATFPDNTVLETINTSDQWLYEYSALRTRGDYSLADIYLQYRYIDTDGTTRPDEVKAVKINPFKPYDDEVYNGTEIRTQDNLDLFDFARQDGDIVTFAGDYIKLDRMIFVPPDRRLVLNAGQTVELTNGATIFCRGPITVNGSESNPVRLISPDGTGDGLVVLQGNASSLGRSEVNWLICDNLDEVNSGIYHLTGCVTFYESDVTICDSQFLNNKSEDGLNIVRSDMAIENCKWSNTFQDAFDGDFCTGYFEGCYFEKTGNDALDVSTSRIEVRDCAFRDIHDKACSIGEASIAYIENIDVVNAQAVIGAKDSSQITARRLWGENVLFGYLAYQKKPEFGHSTAYIEDFVLEGKTDFDYMIEDEETYYLDGKRKLPRAKKKEALLIEKIINEEPIQ
jgi:hypothetical protein